MRYLPLDKLVLALIITSQKLMHYFQAYSIVVCTLSFEGPKIRKEPPQDAEEPTIENLFKGLEVCKEPPHTNDSSSWKMYVDSAKNSLGVGVDILLKSHEGAFFEYYLKLNFPAINNKVEYEAFIAELQSISKLKALELHIFSDAKLMVNQVTGKFESQGSKMAKYLAIAKTSSQNSE